MESGDAVVDGDEDGDGERDDEGPDADGDGERHEGWGVAADDGFRDEEDQAEGVPERHDGAEEFGEEAEGAGLGFESELAESWVDEDGDSELDANHEAEGEDGDDVEGKHEEWYTCGLEGVSSDGGTEGSRSRGFYGWSGWSARWCFASHRLC